MRLLLAVIIFFSAVFAQAQTPGDLFDDRVLHEVRLYLHPADWGSLKENFRDNTYYPADLEWFFGGHPVTVSQISVRSRGVGSRNPVKPGLLLDFTRYNDTLRFLGLRSLVLRGNVQDASMLREHLAMALMRRMAMPAPRESFARLYVNGEYLGVYSLVESVDRNFLERNFGEDNGHLYSYQYDFELLDYRFEYLGSDPHLYSPRPFEPETHKDDPDPAPIEAMIRAMNQASDAGFVAAVSRYLNFAQVMKFVAVENYIAEQDGLLGDWGMNNFFLYRFQNSDVSQFIPWDKSIAFFHPSRSIWENTEGNVLIRRALAVTTLRTVFVSEILNSAAAAGGPGGWLEQEVTRLHTLIRGAALEDSKKLCDPAKSGQLRPCSNAEFEADTEFLGEFARERNNFVFRELGR